MKSCMPRFEARRNGNALTDDSGPTDVLVFIHGSTYADAHDSVPPHHVRPFARQGVNEHPNGGRFLPREALSGSGPPPLGVWGPGRAAWRRYGVRSTGGTRDDPR